MLFFIFIFFFLPPVIFSYCGEVVAVSVLGGSLHLGVYVAVSELDDKNIAEERGRTHFEIDIYHQEINQENFTYGTILK